MNEIDKKSFVIHLDMLNVLDELDEKQAGKLLIAIREYQLRLAEKGNQDVDAGNDWEIKDFITRIAFAPFKTQFDREYKNWLKASERNRENVLKRWGAKNTNPINRKQKDTKNTSRKSCISENTKNTNRNDNVNDNDNVNVKGIVDFWNAKNWNLPKIQKLNQKRKTVINSRIKDFDLEKIFEVINSVENSEFLRGKNKQNWVANFDWVMKSENFIKILEGNYSTKKTEITQQFQAGRR